MAKITTEFDTKDKTLVTKLDGEAIENVSHVSFWKWDDDAENPFHASITKREKSEDKDMEVTTHISANAQGETVQTEETVAADDATTENLGKALFPNRND